MKKVLASLVAVVFLSATLAIAAPGGIPGPPGGIPPGPPAGVPPGPPAGAPPAGPSGATAAAPGKHMNVWIKMQQLMPWISLGICVSYDVYNRYVAYKAAGSPEFIPEADWDYCANPNEDVRCDGPAYSYLK